MPHSDRTPSRTPDCYSRALLTLIAALGVAAGPALAGDTTRVSLTATGGQANAESGAHYARGMNGAGTVIAFTSAADNLIAGDSNGVDDVFVRDRKSGHTTRVSVASDGSQGNDVSAHGTVSVNGRYVAFASRATNLVPGDTNGWQDVYLHDRQSGATKRVSVNSAGIEGNSVSGGSGFLAVSGNGRAVLYSSSASNLAAGDTNGDEDVFRHDVKSGDTVRVSVADDGSEGAGFSAYPAPSANGKLVAFLSTAANLVPGDTNGAPDVFVRDLRKGTTRRVSVASDGSEANGTSGAPAISLNGRVIAFVSAASNLVPGDTNDAVDVFVHDGRTGATTRVSVASDGGQASGDSAAVSISGNGRFVIFTSDAADLVAADDNGVDDVFVHDRKTGQTTRVNVDGAGVQSAGMVGFDLALSTNGRLALFSSDASTLVIGDSNAAADLFLHDTKD